jgi:hypothetical protein
MLEPDHAPSAQQATLRRIAPVSVDVEVVTAAISDHDQTLCVGQGRVERVTFFRETSFDAAETGAQRSDSASA